MMSFPYAAARDALHHVGQRGDIRVDVDAQFGFGRTYQQCMAQFRIALAKIEPAQDSTARQRRQDRGAGGRSSSTTAS